MSAESSAFKVHLHQPLAGKESWRIANVHVHRGTAKREWGTAADNFRGTLAQEIVTHDIEMLVGDFNMGLYYVCQELRARHREVTLVAPAIFVKKKPAAGQETLHQDSRGVFAIGPVAGIRRLWDASVFAEQAPYAPVDRTVRPNVRATPNTHWQELDRMDHAPGFPMASYTIRAENKAVFPGLVSRALEFEETPNGQPYLPVIYQRKLDPRVWDPRSEIETRGAHCPLLVFCGIRNCGFRSPESLRKR